MGTSARLTDGTALEIADRKLLAGRVVAARKAYERLAASAPEEPTYALRAAAAAEQSGDLDAAVRWSRTALELDPTLGTAFLCLGNALSGLARYPESLEAFRAAVALDPHDADALFRLGQGLLNDDAAEALRVFLRVVALAPDNAQAHAFVGHARARSGQAGSACADLERAVELAPGDAELLRHLGNARLASGDYSGASDAYRRATALVPGDARYWNNLGSALRFEGQPDAALAAYQRALALEPRRAQTLDNVGNLLLDSGDVERAVALLEAAVHQAPEALDYRLDLARAQAAGAALDTAERNARIRLFAGPDCARAVECLASIASLRGETSAGTKLYRHAIALAPTLAPPYYRLAREGAFEDAEALERLVRAPASSNDDRLHLHFALGHVYERRGDHAAAARHFTEGNRRKATSFDPNAHSEWVDGIVRTFTRERIAALRVPSAGGVRPIFIVGAIRSGTSLVEQMVASHPDVLGGGETATLTGLTQGMTHQLGTDRPYPWCLVNADRAYVAGLRDAYLAETRRRLPRHPGPSAPVAFTEKTPTHFLHLGLIAAMFPDAIVLHCQRDPRDAALSAYSLNFNAGNSPYAYDLEHLVAFHRDYLRLMQHWREHLPLTVLDVPYEELVGDAPTWTARLLEHCELPFDERCLRFHENERAVFTASASQVRAPAHRRSIGRWRDYEPYFGRFFAQLVGPA